MRIAWLGPAPAEAGSVASVALQLLQGAAGAGIHLDCFIACHHRDIPAQLREQPGLSFVCRPARWQWDRWYSRTPLCQVITGQAARARAQAQLMSDMLGRHRERPYDLVYQFSQPELFRLRRLRRRLPPIVVHPGTHAAGELRWHRLESGMSSGAEPHLRTAGVRTMLVARAAVQRRDLRLPRMVLALSRVFAGHLSRDCGVPHERLRVVPNPVDLDRFRPRPPRRRDGRTVLLFASRISTRKGVDLVIDLSHRLDDLHDQVSLAVVGDRTLWSDYRPLLARLNRRVAQYRGGATFGEMADHYGDADVVLVPSKFEPFGVVVSEALASGRPVVASDEVGAAEEVRADVCTTFRSNHAAAFEEAVRSAVRRWGGTGAAPAPRAARAEAERLFSPERVVSLLVQHLEEAATPGWPPQSV